MDLFEDAPAGDNTPEYSVSELSGALKKTVEGAFSNVRLRGEIGRVTRPASGHIYLDLKDDKSVINCNIWKGVANRLDIAPEEGMEVIATGKLSTYAPQSKYNFIIDTMEIAGEGALMALLEKRKKALAAEGLFDADRKQLLPYLPKRIGVITSRSGAVIRDIIHRLSDRFPSEVILWPVTVQGEKCADEVVAAIEGFNALPLDHPLRPDVIIVARGGGSIEDLWGFNEERVVRAVANSDLPLISAVGHETDTTLIDYASDMRAPTPTAAAEMAVPVRAELLATLSDLDARRLRSTARAMEQKTRQLRDLTRSLPRAQNLLDTPRQRVDLASSKFGSVLNQQVSLKRNHLLSISGKFSASSLLHTIGIKRATLRSVSDKFAPTLKSQLQNRQHNLTQVHANFTRIFERHIAVSRHRASSAFLQFTPQSLRRNIQKSRSDLGSKSQNLTPAMTRIITNAKRRMDSSERLLNALSYKSILKRGYAVIRDRDNNVLTNFAQTSAAQQITIEQHDGTTSATVKSKG